MTVDFIPLKLYVVKVICDKSSQRGGRTVFCIACTRYYRFSQVRYAGRYLRALQSFPCPAADFTR